jgi:hypothetical protein
MWSGRTIQASIWKGGRSRARSDRLAQRLDMPHQQIGTALKPFAPGKARARRAATAPAQAATVKFLARLGTALAGTVWVGGCEDWYNSRQSTPVLWPLPQSEQKAFFEGVPTGDFEFVPIGLGD